LFYTNHGLLKTGQRVLSMVGGNKLNHCRFPAGGEMAVSCSAVNEDLHAIRKSKFQPLNIMPDEPEHLHGGP